MVVLMCQVKQVVYFKSNIIPMTTNNINKHFEKKIVSKISKLLYVMHAKLTGVFN